MSRLITTTVAGNVSRVYQYSQNGNLLSADVDGLLTTFTYDGRGNRLRMSVAGEVTTYTLDHGNGLQILMEQGGAFAGIKHYLYGVQCIGEQVDADDSEKAEWRYYHRDGNNLVRQTTNEQAKITLAWAYSPEGAVLIGEKGPVTNLGCGDIYDWSTGLVYKDGRYFDPNLGIWTTLTPYLIWQAYKPKKQRGRSRRKRRDRKQLFLLLLFLLVVALALTGCGPGPVPEQIECSIPTTEPPQISIENILLFGGAYGAKWITQEGPEVKDQLPHFNQIATESVKYPGSKRAQAGSVKGNYDNVDLLIIGYSAGADAALMYADNHSGSIKGVGLLAPSMSGTMPEGGEPGGGDLRLQWKGIVDKLLTGGTHIYLLVDASFPESHYAPLVSGYRPPGATNKSGDFYLDNTNTQRQHYDPKSCCGDACLR
jgi:pimeloyl-ACP methyl ester carboxylesterase